VSVLPRLTRPRATRSTQPWWLRAATGVQGAVSRPGVLVATSLYLGYTIWLAWPMPIHLSTTLWGPGGDVLGLLSTWREIAQHTFPFLPGRISSLAYPGGLPVDYAFNITTSPSSTIYWLATLAFGALPAMNLFVVAGFAATGVAVFLLIRGLTGDPWAALICGWGLTFQRDALFNAVTAPDFMHRWALAALVWRALVLQREPTKRNGLLAGAAALLAVSWNPYYLLMGTVAFATLTVVNLALAAKRRMFLRQLRAHAVALAVLGVAAVGYAVVTAVSATSGIRTHSLQDLQLYSARPLEYLMPPPNHVLLRGHQFDWPLARPGTNFYIGLSLVFLAAIAIVRAFRRSTPRHERDAVISLSALGAVALVWSGPPIAPIGRFDFKLPSYYVFQLTSTWRIYGRFGIVVGFAVCILAGFGLAALLRSRQGITRVALILVASVVVFVDVKSPTYPITTYAEPSIYRVLRKQPPGAVAEYPLVAATLGAYDQVFRQDYHGRPILNGYYSGSPAEARALSLARLDDPATPRRLASLGIRYVVLNTTAGYYGPPGAAGHPTRQFRRIAAADGFELYVIACAVSARDAHEAQCPA